ncbi:MAG: lipid ABC transporter permease [Gammaproteobacteria bacterium]|jgi:subfamily B ATP-binding cassette protein MsbA|nr:lipid ABC transporter permease [Gammaproteobacteria bacterium]|tara:strand:+ start:18934 stop:21864 length:2931 start_codon:yes stop_codon:yes gene_type:complete
MNEETSKSDVKIYSRLLSYVIPYWGAFLLSILGFLIFSLSNVSFLQLVSYIVDSIKSPDPLVQSGNSDYLQEIFGPGDSLNRTVIPVAIVLIVVCRGLGTFIGNYFISYVSTNLIHNLRTELFDQLLKLPSKFYDKNAMGHLVAKVTFHVTQVTGAATDAVRVIIREGFTVIGYLGFLLYLNWKLTLIFFAVAPFIALLVRFAGRRFRRISERIQQSMGDVTHVASEAVQGYRLVRTFGGSQYEQQRFDKVSHYNRRQSMKMVITSSIATPVIQLLVAMALAGLVWLVLDPILLAAMTAGSVVAFITTGGLLAKPIRQLSEVNATVQKGLAAAEDIFDLFDQEIEKDDGHVELADVRGHVEFRRVSFSYGEDLPSVLVDVSFTVTPGKTIALVGRSGSGKSTLASLIPAFYAPTKGSILIDEVPIESFALANLRQHIAIVTQQVTLFNDTIRRNIAYGSLQGSSEDEIIEAAKKAFAWDFICELSDGLDTVVGDDGVLLSGGQRQRLAIARAFLKDAPILILDEATSALDSESERYIQAALETVIKGRTTFIIAHRLTTIQKADRILVIDGGRIVEQGTHEQLLSNKSFYSSFYNKDERGKVENETAVHEVKANLLPAPHIPDRGRWFWEDTNPLLKAWYSGSAWVKFLFPLGYLFEQLGKLRRYHIGQSSKLWKAPVPVIVVGNINVGGTGKSPVVIWLAQQLADRGLKPGIVSRGYSGSSQKYPLLVDAQTDPGIAGDEAVMIARRTGCPVVIDPDRVGAVKHLLRETNCDLVISDDGLQHYYLERDVEIVVIDAEKGLGNNLCMPAGPLRESSARLKEVDFVIVNGRGNVTLPVPYQQMELTPDAIINLVTNESLPVGDGKPSPVVHAVAGIGNPSRFFGMLRDLGYNVLEHPFSDHHIFDLSEIVFGDSLPVIMTEKDAVKCRLLSPDLVHEDFWYLEVSAELPPVFVTSVLSRTGLNVTQLHVIPNESVKV